MVFSVSKKNLDGRFAKSSWLKMFEHGAMKLARHFFWSSMFNAKRHGQLRVCLLYLFEGDMAKRCQPPKAMRMWLGIIWTMIGNYKEHVMEIVCV